VELVLSEELVLRCRIVDFAYHEEAHEVLVAVKKPRVPEKRSLVVVAGGGVDEREEQRAPLGLRVATAARRRAHAVAEVGDVDEGGAVVRSQLVHRVGVRGVAVVGERRVVTGFVEDGCLDDSSTFEVKERRQEGSCEQR